MTQNFNSSCVKIFLFTLIGLQVFAQTPENPIISPARNTMNAFTSMNAIYSYATMVEDRISIQRGFLRTAEKGAKTAALLEMDLEELIAAKKIPAGSVKKAAENHCLWGEILGDLASQNGQNNIPSMRFTSVGAFLGYDFFRVKEGMFGVAGGYTRTNLHFAENQGRGSVNSYTIGPYSLAAFNEGGFTEFGVFFSANQNDNKRHVIFSGFHKTASSSHWNYELTPHFSVGWDLATEEWLLFEPFAVFDWVIDWEKKYSESGAAPFNMSVQGKVISMLRSEGGLRCYQVLQRGWGVCMFREVLGYVNKAPFGTKSFGATVIGTANSFSFEGFTEIQNLLTVGFEALLKAKNGWFGSLAYDGEFFSGYLSNQGQASVGVYF